MRFFASFFGNKTLSDLNGLDDRQLSDLGLCRYDLIEASHSRNAVATLSARRSERAAAWLR